MNVNTDLSFLTLIAQASLVVQAVLLLLAFLSCGRGGKSS